MIHSLAPAEQRHFQVVQGGRFRAPQARRVQGDVQHLTGNAFDRGQQLALMLDFNLGIITSQLLTSRHLNRNPLPINVRGRLDPGDVILGHGLDPHRLPNPSHGGIPYALRFANLLASRLIPSVRRIPHPNHQFLVARTIQKRGYVELERRVSAGMRPHLDAVDPHLGLPVHRPEMKQDIVVGPGRRHHKRPLIPHHLVLTHRPLHPR